MSTPTVRGALAWSFAERYLSLLITVPTTMILARLLTPAQVGVYSLCAVVVNLASILRDFGVSEYLIQERELDREKLRSAFTITLAMAWGMALVIGVGRHAIAAWYHEPLLAELLLVLCLNFLMLPLASPSFALLNREMAFHRICVVQVSANAANALTSISLAWTGHGALSLAWGPVAGIAVQVAILVWLRPRESVMMPRLRGAGRQLRYGAMFTASRLVESGSRNAHELIIGKQFGFTSLGLFSRATGLIDLLGTTVSSAILRVATPALAADHRAGHSLVAPYAKGTAIFTGIAWPFMGGVALMSRDILALLFGNQWLEAAPIATLLAIAGLPYALTMLAPNALAAMGQVKRRLSVALWYGPIHLTCVLIASLWNLHAVAAVFVVGNLVSVAMYTRHLTELMATTPRALFGPSWSSAKLALGCCAGIALAQLGCYELSVPLIPRIALCAVGGTLAWLGSAALLNHPAMIEVRRLITHMRSRHA
ncbi:MAG: lipopolysaccharide biosynthesis protein [Burkholderiaceae bacterium]